MGRAYHKHEFCRDVRCPGLAGDKCNAPTAFCPLTAKQFHEWLRDNGFEIIKKDRKES